MITYIFRCLCSRVVEQIAEDKNKAVDQVAGADSSAEEVEVLVTHVVNLSHRVISIRRCSVICDGHAATKARVGVPALSYRDGDDKQYLKTETEVIVSRCDCVQE